MSFTLERNPQPVSGEARRRILAEPGFGKYFTDHMFRMAWSAEHGWGRGAIEPYGPLPLDPATMVLHYGQEIFEGLKAYRQHDGSVAIFRPDQNALRFQRSARRLGMPELPVETFIDSLRALVEIDAAWVPEGEGNALYLRPFMIATEVGLAAHASTHCTYLVVASPTSSYFGSGDAGPASIGELTVWIATEYIRAAPGGTGEAKFGGNYAAAVVSQQLAREQGCDQVVWLDAIERRYVEEMGTNNLFFVYGTGDDARLMTPALTGTLLPGVTRSSVIAIAEDLGMPVEEGRISVEQWRHDSESGALTEVFGCGTAAGVVAIARVRSADGDWTVGDGTPGSVTQRLWDRLRRIQSGEAPDTRGWLLRLDGAPERTAR